MCFISRDKNEKPARNPMASARLSKKDLSMITLVESVLCDGFIEKRTLKSVTLLGFFRVLFFPRTIRPRKLLFEPI